MALASATTDPIVIVGAGIVGCSIAYHLIERGIRNFVLIDRGSLDEPIGSTGHAPGLLAQVSASPFMTGFATESIALYTHFGALEQVFTDAGSIEVARKEETMNLLRRKVARATESGIEASVITPEEVSSLVPLIDASDLIGGLYVPSDGVLDARATLRVFHDLFQEAKVDIRSGVTVTGIVQREGEVMAVQTDHGPINCAEIVVAAGIWGADLLGRAGVTLPLFPVQHPYTYTEPLAEWEGETHPSAHPLVRDIETLTYYRQHQDRMGYGWYAHQPVHQDMSNLWASELPYDDDLFGAAPAPELFPALASAKTSHQLNGIFSMTPDGLPLVGPDEYLHGLWLAEAIWVTHAGGVGRFVADMIAGRPVDEDTAAAMSPKRFQGHDVDSELHKASALSLYNDIYHWPAP